MNSVIYSALFYQSVQLLLSRRISKHRLHLGWLTALFLLDLSTIHIALAYVWALIFTTDTADTAIYELFSLENPLPVLYLPDIDDPISVHRTGFVLKFRYSPAKCLPHFEGQLDDDHDLLPVRLILSLCYVICGYKWRAIALLIVAYVFTCTISVTLGMLPLPESSERTAMAICIGSGFFTNVLGAGLTAQPDEYGGFLEQRPGTPAGAHGGNISMKAIIYVPLSIPDTRRPERLRRYLPFLFPVPQNRKRAHLSGRTGACHHRLPHTLNARGVGVDMPCRLLPYCCIAPTFLIVRAGLGVSTDEDDVETGLIIGEEAGAGGGRHEFPVPRGHNTTMELEARGQVRISKGGGTTPRSFPRTIIAL
ncbi:hypothetical protein B0H14DRAFT_2564522 [Mycena olivaceomarginata]|nr:hypothetical protein B0H14DRAFT_2564522 [Mycena olivaceomarginata]